MPDSSPRSSNGAEQAASTRQVAGSSPAGGTDALVLKWAWRHHVLGVEEYGDLEDAVSSAYWAAEHGDEALEAIEIVAADGASRLIGVDEVERMFRAYEVDIYPMREVRPTVARIDIRAPSGKTAVWSGYSDAAEANAEFVRLATTLGPRVTLVPVSK